MVNSCERQWAKFLAEARNVLAIINRSGFAGESFGKQTFPEYKILRLFYHILFLVIIAQKMTNLKVDFYLDFVNSI
jgi:hypothetical protein